MCSQLHACYSDSFLVRHAEDPGIRCFLCLHSVFTLMLLGEVQD